MIRPSTITLHRPAKFDGCVPTHSGLQFNILDPRPENVCLEDICQGLAYKFRYGGQIGPITVAEHSCLVARVIATLWPKSKAILPGLLHDACEAYTHDIQAPVRKFVRVTMPNGDLITWGDLERKINAAVSKALWNGDDFYSYPEVQAADILALAIEKKDLPTIRDERWGLPTIPPEVADFQVAFWSPDEAATQFRAQFERLTNPGS